MAVKKFMLWLFGLKPAQARLKPLRRPAEATLPVIRAVTMPDGEKIRVIRDDVFKRAIRRGSGPF